MTRGKYIAEVVLFSLGPNPMQSIADFKIHTYYITFYKCLCIKGSRVIARGERIGNNGVLQNSCPGF